MDAETQLRRYREAVGDARYFAALANEGRNEDGECRSCGRHLPAPHKKECAWHPANIQRDGRPTVASAAGPSAGP